MPRVVGRPAVALARPPKLDEQARRPARRGRQLWWARGADPHVDQVRCGHDKCTAHVQLAPRRARVARRRRDNLAGGVGGWGGVGACFDQRGRSADGRLAVPWLKCSDMGVSPRPKNKAPPMSSAKSTSPPPPSPALSCV
eukprot:272281-Chlamydomonas_euryale.AAC.1